ncbi:MAG: hypothetical protein WCW44_01290 [archaeon]|jgi:hypothetical protein
MARNILTIFIALVTFSILFGCVATPQQMVESNGIIKDYLYEHPNSKVTVAPYSEKIVVKSFWTDNCKNSINFDRNYYLAEVEDSNLTLRALFEKSQMIFICGVITDTSTNEIIPQTNSNTLQQKTCSSEGGLICDLNQKCAGNWMKVTDTDRCCDNLCKVGLTVDSKDTTPEVIEKAICEGVPFLDCNSNQKCTSIAIDRNVECGCAKCEEKICTDYGGLVCPRDTNCYGNITSMPDTQNCCLGVCYKVEVTMTDTNDTNTTQ